MRIVKNEGMRFLIALIVFLPSFVFGQNEGKENEVKEKDVAIPEYITKYSGLAKEEMRRTGIPASITLAQGILESSYGNSRLAKKANNHFGIKCGSNWDGPTFIQDDDEEKECFRKYETVYQSYRDHSLFLIGKDRYDNLFKLGPKDYKGWAEGLKKAGYATNPNYATLLIRLIEERNLHAFDTQSKYVALTTEEAEELKSMDNKYFVFNGIKTVVSQPNEMAIDIATKYDVSLSQLLNYNDLNEGDFIPPGSKIYLQPKKTKGYEVYHRVAEGENMHAISQIEGIKLKSLYTKNRMTWGQEPVAGETLCLRKKCASSPKLKTDAEIKKDIKEDIQKKMDETVKKNQEKEPKQQAPVKNEKPQIQEAAAAEVKKVNEPVIEEKTTVVNPPVEYKTSSAKQPRYHKVAEQETIYKICSTYKVSAEEVRKWNELSSNALSVGQLLIVGYTSNLAEEVVEKKEEPKDEIIIPEVKEEKTVPDKTTTSKQPKYHTVAPKETLYRVSTLYKVTVDELKKWNKLVSNEITIGQKLIVGYEMEEVPVKQTEKLMEEKPAPAEVRDEVPASNQPTYHKVQEGETLYTIGQKYKLNVEILKKLNNLITNDLRPGQVLKLR